MKRHSPNVVRLVLDTVRGNVKALSEKTQPKHSTSCTRHREGKCKKALSEKTQPKHSTSCTRHREGKFKGRQWKDAAQASCSLSKAPHTRTYRPSVKRHSPSIVRLVFDTLRGNVKALSEKTQPKHRAPHKEALIRLNGHRCGEIYNYTTVYIRRIYTYIVLTNPNHAPCVQHLTQGRAGPQWRGTVQASYALWKAPQGGTYKPLVKRHSPNTIHVWHFKKAHCRQWT